ncbi:hypothetical protein FQA47_024388 [Oryzias melastigma]|uniref:Integrase core domain-containing protein n=1 Tax=Oryzias melastigma TaxID=30732 RepID=A0A834CKM9_ORYME|nr:hypothetical protein FQA47_024388 [Oryzias melastigma]
MQGFDMPASAWSLERAALLAIEHQVRLDYTTEELSKHAGRPCLEVPLEALRTLVLCGMTTKAIANTLAVSESTVRRRMLEEGLRKSDRYSTVGDEELDTIVLELQRCYPNAGCRMMMGHLRSRGIQVQRSRLADSLRRVNPEGVMMRRLSIQIARRRQYNVPAPNHLWHIDGNHKLIRIERLWRDVYENVLDLFYTLFTQLEIQGLLNPGDEIDIYALHRCFLHHIQQHLHTFKEAWNHHGLRTTNNRSPLQLWLQHRREGQDISEVQLRLIHILTCMKIYAEQWKCISWLNSKIQFFSLACLTCQVNEDYGVDWTGPHNPRPLTEVIVPEIQLPRTLNEQELSALPNTNVPLGQSLQVYFETIHALRMMF